MPTVLKILDSKNSNLVSGYDDKTQRRSLGEAFEKRMREMYPEILEDARKQRARTTKKEIAPPQKQKRVVASAKTTENANNVTKKPRGENANENNTKNKISTTNIFSQHQQEQHTSSFAFSFWAKEEETNDTTTQANTDNTNT
jgi:hypothetical protein